MNSWSDLGGDSIDPSPVLGSACAAADRIKGGTAAASIAAPMGSARICTLPIARTSTGDDREEPDPLQVRLPAPVEITGFVESASDPLLSRFWDRAGVVLGHPVANNTQNSS